jgi:hypothetical protein
MKINRNEDVIYQKNDLQHLYTIKNFPVFMGCVKEPSDNDIIADMNFFISKTSGIIQLNPILSLDHVYLHNHGSGKVGKIWEEHHLEFAKFINKFSPTSILEIGGGSGNLSSSYHSTYEIIEWTIIEPNASEIKNSNVKVISEFFDENTVIDFEFDSIVHSHVFEHVFYPNEFLSLLKTYLPSDKKMFFSVPNLKEMLTRGYTNFMNFEHTVFLSEDYIDFLLKKYNFQILEKVFFKEDHSIFYAVTNSRDDIFYELSADIFDKNKEMFLNYINTLHETVSSINNSIKNKKEVYLFGGHVFSQYLIILGLDISNIKYILDNDADKHRKRLYGTELIVNSPKILSGVKDPIVILCSSTYKDEIRNDIVNINKDTIFIE